jgi:isoprenylcysteine carboxyl methyltransferase (ICMT) family protein YpbQ
MFYKRYKGIFSFEDYNYPMTAISEVLSFEHECYFLSQVIEHLVLTSLDQYWSTRLIIMNRQLPNMSHGEQELLTLPKHLSSPHVFGGVRVARSLVFCSVVLSLLAIVLHVRLPFTSSNSPFGIFKLLLH